MSHGRLRGLAVAALLLAAGCSHGTSSGAAPAKTFGAYDQANLVIISLDTLRARDTTMGGGPAEISPTLAKFAAEGVYFEQARANAPHTAPSHMSLFTSTLPSVHGVQNVSFNKAGAEKSGDKSEPDEDEMSGPNIVPARKDVPTLAEVLKAAGFHTVGLTDGGNLNPAHGFARGFDTYTHDLEGAADKVKLGQEWVGKLAADSQRFFLFWHTYQIHAPYCPPDEYVKQWAPADYTGVMRERLDSLAGLSFKERFSKMKTLFWKDRDSFKDPEARFLHGVYQAGIRFTDDQIGGLFQSLRDAGLLDRSIVVVVADHGEEFFEHGHWQHEDLYEECLRVPLIVRLPDGRTAGTRIKTPVDLISVMPTVLELLGVDASKLAGLPGPVRPGGVSLAETLVTGHEPKPRPIISELINDRAKGGDFERQVAINANDMTFLYDRVRGHRDAAGQVIFDHYLYDLAQDPGQKQDLVPQGGPKLAKFVELEVAYEKLIKLEQRDPSELVGQSVSAEDAEQFAQLGYIGPAATSAPAASKGFDVVLTAVKPDKKSPVAKIVAEVAPMDPQVAWGLVDTVPKTVKSGLTRQEADALVKRLADAGGTAEIR